MVLFIDAETGTNVYVNPDTITHIRETRLGSNRYVSRINFVDDTYLLVTEDPKTCVEKLSKKTSK